MPDGEKVISKLQILRTWCAVNPDYDTGLSAEDCVKAVGWLDDAIALLKAQEPVEPTEPDEDNMVCCGACGSPVGYEVLEPSGMDYVRYNYCPNCGRAVKWE